MGSLLGYNFVRGYKEIQKDNFLKNKVISGTPIQPHSSGLDTSEGYGLMKRARVHKKLN